MARQSVVTGQLVLSFIAFTGVYHSRTLFFSFERHHVQNRFCLCLQMCECGDDSAVELSDRGVYL